MEYIEQLISLRNSHGVLESNIFLFASKGIKAVHIYMEIPLYIKYVKWLESKK